MKYQKSHIYANCNSTERNNEDIDDEALHLESSNLHYRYDEVSKLFANLFCSLKDYLNKEEELDIIYIDEFFNYAPKSHKEMCKVIEFIKEYFESYEYHFQCLVNENEFIGRYALYINYICFGQIKYYPLDNMYKVDFYTRSRNSINNFCRALFKEKRKIKQC